MLRLPHNPYSPISNIAWVIRGGVWVMRESTVISFYTSFYLQGLSLPFKFTDQNQVDSSGTLHRDHIYEQVWNGRDNSVGSPWVYSVKIFTNSFFLSTCYPIMSHWRSGITFIIRRRETFDTFPFTLQAAILMSCGEHIFCLHVIQASWSHTSSCQVHCYMVPTSIAASCIPKVPTFIGIV